MKDGPFGRLERTRTRGAFAAITLRYEAIRPVLDERGHRRFAAAEALAAGWGGIAAVSTATGIARSTIGYGLRGTAADSALGGIRRKGAGRKPLTQTDPTLLSDLEALVDPATRGDPMSPLKWTSIKSSADSQPRECEAKA